MNQRPKIRSYRPMNSTTHRRSVSGATTVRQQRRKLHFVIQHWLPTDVAVVWRWRCQARQGTTERQNYELASRVHDRNAANCCVISAAAIGQSGLCRAGIAVHLERAERSHGQNVCEMHTIGYCISAQHAIPLRAHPRQRLAPRCYCWPADAPATTGVSRHRKL